MSPFPPCRVRVDAMAFYDAFISYSHAKDKPIASALQSAVQKLGKPWYRRRALRVFRDDTSLSATPHMWPTIEQALSQSRYFILLASPQAAASKWVMREVAYWLDHNSIETLLIGLTDGDLSWDEAAGDFTARASTPLPPVLAKRFAAEPRWIDLRAYRDGADKAGAKFTELAADFAAAIHGKPKEDLLSQEVRQQRHALRLAWSAAAALLLLTGLATTAGILAYRSQQEAIAQRDRAEQTLATTNGLLYDLAAQFRDARGVPAALIKDILDRARASQDQLTASGQTSEELQTSTARALMETQRTLLTIGDTAGAFAAADRARTILAGLLARQPDSFAWQHDLSVTYGKLGDVLLKQGRLDDALKAFHEGRAINERLFAADPRNAELHHLLSFSYHRIADVLQAQGKLDEALRVYERDVVVRQRLTEFDRSNTEWQRSLSVAHGRIGDLRLRMSQPDRALEAYRAALAVARRLAAANRDNTEWQQDVAICQEKVGDALREQGELDAALDTFRDNLGIYERLAASDPGNFTWQYDVAFAHYKVAEVLELQSKLDDALEAYHQSIAIRSRLAERDPNQTDVQYYLSMSYRNVGRVLQAQGKLDDAERAYREKLAILERLLARRQNSLWQHDLAMGHSSLASIWEARGRLSEALAEFTQAHDMLTLVVAAAPAEVRWKRDLTSLEEQIARLQGQVRAQ
jgi:tetratricopeptide (TPR) repeat protein